jgi:hypothetical protein
MLHGKQASRKKGFTESRLHGKKVLREIVVNQLKPGDNL